MRKGLWSAALLGSLAGLVAIILLPYGATNAANALDPFAALVARLTHATLGVLGVDALRTGTFLYAPSVFEFEIRPGCAGILPTVVLTVAVLYSPGSSRAKWWGLAVGIPLVLSLNLLRLAHLFYIGVHSPSLFGLAHTVLWEGTMVLVTFAVWLAWARWATRVGQLARPGVERMRMPDVVASGST
jgi:exosortase/archaeosortase family protein